jgi:hypothetical protein
VVIKQEDAGVDVLPKQIFEMMVLPDGAMEPGSRVDVSMPLGNLRVELAALEGPVATLRTTMAGNKVEVTTPAEQADPVDGQGAEDEDMGGMNMGGMNMGGAPGGESMTAGMKMDVDVTCGFDVAAGRLLSLSGTLASDMGMGGMGGMGGMKVNSRFTLKRVP